ncbi:DUF6473 family protein [Nereida sp. MMG025]|uniref:DUF6473 family protein n=1 Tax=Nereida sp. MMG025 TaxID=2909981 RepID=UPI001F261371|nr:DUF6473 family protein [Nereida sp. MMG025]MCF6445943.1 DUF6473 family protein [Nereida sp. MMG025]
MTFENMGRGALTYLPCRYGRSKLVFRGPSKNLNKPYVAFLGGTETYGKFLKRPFADLVEQEIGLTCVNLGCVNAGPDAFLNDPFVTPACSKARATVIEVMGANNLTNRFYSVHPRRNDRFLKASGLMQTVFRDVDFTEFAFTRHLLSRLKELSPDRYEILEAELKEAWIARMKALVSKIEGKTVLLWASEHEQKDQNDLVGLGPDPLFVTRSMIDAVRPYVTEVIEYQPSAQARASKLDGMFLTEMEQPAAEDLMGQAAHEEIAGEVAEVLSRLL